MDRRNDMAIYLHPDPERGWYLEDNQRFSENMYLTNKEMKKLRSLFILNKKDLLRIALFGQNCSICYDSLDNKKKKVIKLPKCDHLFHWK